MAKKVNASAIATITVKDVTITLNKATKITKCPVNLGGKAKQYKIVISSDKGKMEDDCWVPATDALIFEGDESLILKQVADILEEAFYAHYPKEVYQLYFGLPERELDRSFTIASVHCKELKNILEVEKDNPKPIFQLMTDTLSLSTAKFIEKARPIIETVAEERKAEERFQREEQKRKDKEARAKARKEKQVEREAKKKTNTKASKVKPTVKKKETVRKVRTSKKGKSPEQVAGNVKAKSTAQKAKEYMRKQK